MTTSEQPDGGQSQSVAMADGTTVSKSLTADPRYKELVSLGSGAVTLPSGLTSTGGHTRSVQRAAGDPFMFESIIDTYTLDGHASTSTYDKQARTITGRSPLGVELNDRLDTQWRAAGS